LNPLISVVVTTYNQAAYIEQTLQSVLAQTYHPYEVIVVDDGSTDDTPNRIAPFEDRIVYIRQKNQGVASSRNTGIRQARGEYIAFLDGDDLWDPEKLSVQVAVARLYPDSGLIAVDGSEFDAGGTISPSLFFVPWCKELPEGSVTTGRYHHQLLQCNFITTTSQVMVPAKVFESIGISDKSFKGASDYDLYIRIAAKYNFTLVKKRLIRWRYLPTSVSGPKRLRGFRYICEDIAIIKKHLRQSHGEELNFMRQIIKKRLAEGAGKIYYFGLETDRCLATRFLMKLLAENRFSPLVAVFLLGLWCPLAITNSIGWIVRKIFLNNCTETQNV
jgi:glycosyltransferase involved in cell wall biosynthesis